MSASPLTAWRPVYDAGETVEQFAARQRQAFAAFELAWREGRVSAQAQRLLRPAGARRGRQRLRLVDRRTVGRGVRGQRQHDQAGAGGADHGGADPARAAVRIVEPHVSDQCTTARGGGTGGRGDQYDTDNQQLLPHTHNATLFPT